MCAGSLAKDFHKLLKSIASFSNNQAEVRHYEENLEAFKVEIVPNDGLYCGGKFNFEVTLKDYPKTAPSVTCVTQIYHPNIDNDNGEICLNLFSEWSETYTLEDCVQGLLFLMYNPNLEDPLSPLFDPEDDNSYDDFAKNVRRSLQGEEVDGYTFERNLVDDDKGTCTNGETTKETQQTSQNDTPGGSGAVINECEVMNGNTTDENSDLNATEGTGSTQTNEGTADSNLNTKSEETADFIPGKVRTEEDNTTNANTELNTTEVIESTQTNEDTADSNLNIKSEETADFIPGKVRTEEDNTRNENTELKTTEVIESTQTNEDTADSNLNIKSEETADFIPGKVRTEEDNTRNEKTELNTTEVIESTQTNEDTADSNLNMKSEEATDIIPGKVHPHRTEEDIVVTTEIEACMIV